MLRKKKEKKKKRGAFEKKKRVIHKEYTLVIPNKLNLE